MGRPCQFYCFQTALLTYKQSREIQPAFDNQFRCIMELLDDQYEAVRRSDPAARVSDLNCPLIRTKKPYPTPDQHYSRWRPWV